MNQPRSAISFVVADDAAIVSLAVSELLEEAGARVLGIASNGEQALRMVHETRPDGLVLDVEMPQLSGIDVLRMLRAHEAASQAQRPCVVIVITTHDEPSIRDRCMQAGANHFLDKSSGLEHLLTIVESLHNPTADQTASLGHGL